MWQDRSGQGAIHEGGWESVAGVGQDCRGVRQHSGSGCIADGSCAQRASVYRACTPPIRGSRCVLYSVGSLCRTLCFSSSFCRTLIRLHASADPNSAERCDDYHARPPYGVCRTSKPTELGGFTHHVLGSRLGLGGFTHRVDPIYQVRARMPTRSSTTIDIGRKMPIDITRHHSADEAVSERAELSAENPVHQSSTQQESQSDNPGQRRLGYWPRRSRVPPHAARSASATGASTSRPTPSVTSNPPSLQQCRTPPSMHQLPEQAVQDQRASQPGPAVEANIPAEVQAQRDLKRPGTAPSTMRPKLAPLTPGRRQPKKESYQERTAREYAEWRRRVSGSEMNSSRVNFVSSSPVVKCC